MRTSFQSLVALSGCVLLATQADGQASTVTTYSDTECMDALTKSSTFGAIIAGEDFTSFSLGPFNTCTEITFSGVSTGQITVCDIETGEYGLNSYSDGECSAVVSELAALPECMEIPDCVGGACSMETACTDTEPSSISPNTYNFLADEYDSPDCTEPTNEQQVVSGDVFSPEFANGECTELSNLYVLTECMDDGTVKSQTFGSADSTCSGEVFSESEALQSLDTDTCNTVEVDGKHYNLVRCTTDAATVGEGATDTDSTPGPTPGVDAGDGGVGTADTPAPAEAVGGDEMSMSPTVAGEGNGSRELPTAAPTEAGTDEDGDRSGEGTSGALGSGSGVGTVATIGTCALGVMGTMLAM